MIPPPLAADLDRRRLEIDGTANARDLGGLPAGSAHVRTGRLLRSANLGSLTPAGVALLRDQVGLRAVLDLRTDGERRLEGVGPVHDIGAVHHALSLVPEQGPGDDRVLPDRRGSHRVDVYRGYLEDAPDQVAEALHLLAGTTIGPVLVHCAAGKDRTGVLVGIVLDLVGVPREAILADFEASNADVDRVIALLSATGTYRHDVAGRARDEHLVDAADLAAVLDGLDRDHGGTANWARGVGVSDADLRQLTANLVG